MSELIEKAERLGRRLARLLMGMGFALLGLQALYVQLPGGPSGTPLRMADIVMLIAWCFLVLACLFAMVGGGGYGYGKQVRALVNDETARANRDAAIRIGFVAAMLVSLIMFVSSYFAKTDVRLTCHMVITAGLGIAMIRYGALEKRDYRSG